MALEKEKTYEKIQKTKPNKISLALDNYDEIFSDFDQGEIQERRISDDFIEELKKMALEKDTSQFEIIMLIPKQERNVKTEQTITNRLISFFKIKFYEEKKIKTKHKKQGLRLLLAGLTLLFIAGYISKFQSSIIVLRILFVLTEPAGWYFAWTGFEKIFDTREKSDELFSFYTKMIKSKFKFES
jgi:hypothetical protein